MVKSMHEDVLTGDCKLSTQQKWNNLTNTIFRSHDDVMHHSCKGGGVCFTTYISGAFLHADMDTGYLR